MQLARSSFHANLRLTPLISHQLGTPFQRTLSTNEPCSGLRPCECQLPKQSVAVDPTSKHELVLCLTRIVMKLLCPSVAAAELKEAWPGLWRW